MNISVNIGAGQQPQIWGNMQTTVAAGGAPAFDAMLGQDDSEVLPRLKDGLLQPMDNWQELTTAPSIPAVADGTSSRRSGALSCSPATACCSTTG